MPTLVIVGAQWGDEAKGKIVDALGPQAKYVVRYSGGDNAGHTVTVGKQVFKFHLLPAGILHPNATAILGGGMVVCPKNLLKELDETRAVKPDLGRLLISPAAHVVFPYHKRCDVLEEQARGEAKIGTTARGIGPAYTDKTARCGIRMGEFVDPNVFPEKLKEAVALKNRQFSIYNEPELDADAILREYQPLAERLRPYVIDTETELAEAIEAGERVLFEGAQGTLLDLDYGTYPFVTSSHPIASGACLGAGVGPRAIDSVLGVSKAYTTRVGAGPFPTELLDAMGDRIREQGKEYGATTGRPRRCGWLDLVALRYSCRINSMSGLIVTRIDVLDGIEELKVCTGYRLNGKELRGMPTTPSAWDAVEPVYETLPGWNDGVRTARHFEDLPAEARNYLEFIESYTKTPVSIASVGPDRAETIMVRPNLIWG